MQKMLQKNTSDASSTAISAGDWQAKLRAFKKADRQYKHQSLKLNQEYKASASDVVQVPGLKRHSIHSISSPILAIQRSGISSLMNVTADQEKSKGQEERKNVDREEQINKSTNCTPPSIKKTRSPKNAYTREDWD